MSVSHAVSDPFDPRYQSICFYLADDVAHQWDSFAVLTAYNPHGKLASQVENDQASERLEATLVERGFEFVAIAGSAPDDSHAEPGFGLRCAHNEARVLAQKFQQLAYYWVCDGRLFLEATLEKKRVELGSWSRKVRYRPAGPSTT